MDRRDPQNRGSATAGRHWSVPGGGSPGRLCPSVAQSVRRVPCIPQDWGRVTVSVDVSSSTVPDSSVLQHQEYARGLADGSRHAPVQRGSRAGLQTRNPGFLQPSLPGAQEDGNCVLSSISPVWTTIRWFHGSKWLRSGPPSESTNGQFW